MNAFKAFLEEKGLPKPDDLSNEQLRDALHIFYPSIQKKDSSDMKTSTLKGVRAAINPYYKDRRAIDIVSDPLFLEANEMFKGVLMKNKENGLGTVEHKKIMIKTDLDLIENHFSKALKNGPDPRLLMECNIFHIIYYFARRGRENLRKMTKQTFDIAKDPKNGCLFLYQKLDECDKNHKETDTKPSNEGRMYEIPG